MPLVAIITRTKNRPLMLTRAARCILRQSAEDFEWVIVNDGGPIGPVHEIAEQSRAAGLNVRVLHNQVSHGMEGAANRGIRESDSDYLVIHDDDDTWEPRFLERTTAVLSAHPMTASTRGVVCQSTMVIEIVEGDRIVEKRRVPYNPRLSAVTLFQMAGLRKIPPPISFLYRRSVWEEIGPYREDLSVLGDWEFNLRFLRRFDIDVVPEALANYHIRTTLSSGAYGNTVVAGVDQHMAAAARLRNEFLRDDLDRGHLGMGFLVNLCQELEVVKSRPSSIIGKIARRVFPPALVESIERMREPS